MIAESRESAQTIPPECTSDYLPWSEARDKPVPPAPVSATEVVATYPQEEVTFCQAFTAGAGKKLAGVAFPDIRYSFGLGDSQKTLAGSHKLIDHQLDTLVNQSVAMVSSDSGYQRVTLPVLSENWVFATGFDRSNSAGCVTYKNSVKSYNFCRFPQSDNSGVQVYGHLIDGDHKCSGIGVTFNNESSEFEQAIMESEVFEIFVTPKGASGASAVTTSLLTIFAGYVGSQFLK